MTSAGSSHSRRVRCSLGALLRRALIPFVSPPPMTSFPPKGPLPTIVLGLSVLAGVLVGERIKPLGGGPTLSFGP